MADAPGISVKKVEAPSKGPSKALGNTPLPKTPYASSVLHDDEVIYDETRKLYSSLNNQTTAQKYKRFLEILNEIFPKGDRYVLLDEKHLHALHTSFVRLHASYDEATETAIFKTRDHGKITVKEGSLTFEPGMEKRGRKTVSKPFTMNDAYDLAMLALHDRNMLPPNKFEIANATLKQRAMIQIALNHVQKEFLPKDMKFKIHGGLNPITINACRARFLIRDNYKDIMMRVDDSKKEHELFGVDGDDDKVYTKAKELLLSNPEKYENALFTTFAKDLQDSLTKSRSGQKLNEADMTEILDRLNQDKVANIVTTGNSPTITDIVRRPELGNIKYNRLVLDITENPDAWKGKTINDVATFIYGNRKLSEAQTNKIAAIWNRLADAKIINPKPDGTIEFASSALKGTSFAKDFAAASEFRPINSLKSNITNGFNIAAKKTFVDGPVFLAKKGFEGAVNLGTKVWKKAGDYFSKAITPKGGFSGLDVTHD